MGGRNSFGGNELRTLRAILRDAKNSGFWCGDKGRGQGISSGVVAPSERKHAPVPRVKPLCGRRQCSRGSWPEVWRCYQRANESAKQIEDRGRCREPCDERDAVQSKHEAKRYRQREAHQQDRKRIGRCDLQFCPAARAAEWIACGRDQAGGYDVSAMGAPSWRSFQDSSGSAQLVNARLRRFFATSPHHATNDLNELGDPTDCMPNYALLRTVISSWLPSGVSIPSPNRSDQGGNQYRCNPNRQPNECGSQSILCCQRGWRAYPVSR